MAKVKHNKFTMGLSGKFGNLVFRQTKDGRTIVAAAPDFSNRAFSKEQLTSQNRFKQAVAYARVAAKSQPIYTERTRKTSSNAYNLALSDWFNPPIIHEVSRGDGCIRVVATDNVQVTQVLITISDAEGRTIEQGQARMMYETQWEYATSAPTQASVTVEAFDLAGNITRQEA
jgi:hypothetical protein